MPTHDWTPKNRSFQLDYKLYHKKTFASIISISKEAGVELVMNFLKSVNSEKYCQYLRDLRKKYPLEKIALFAD
jgi:F0F1-type ATP synthase delta subunit